MSFGLGLLRIAPRDFWTMTPREFERAAAAMLPPMTPLGRDEFGALMAAFPDHATAKDVTNG